MLIEETNTMLNHPTAGTKSFLSQVEDNVSLLQEYKGMLAILNEDFGDK
jgi:hypothetical protein